MLSFGGTLAFGCFRRASASSCWTGSRGASVFGGATAALSSFGFSGATSGFTDSGGTGRFCFSGFGGCIVVGGGIVGGALLFTVSAGGTGGLSFGFRLSAFSVSAGFGGVVSVTPEVGGTEALGATLSRCLFLVLSRVTSGVVPGATDAAGVVAGETFSSRLFLLLSGVIAGLTEAAALGAGETLS